MSQLQRIEAALREADRRAQQGDQQAAQDAQRLAQAYRLAQQQEGATGQQRPSWLADPETPQGRGGFDNFARGVGTGLSHLVGLPIGAAREAGNLTGLTDFENVSGSDWVRDRLAPLGLAHPSSEDPTATIPGAMGEMVGAFGIPGAGAMGGLGRSVAGQVGARLPASSVGRRIVDDIAETAARRPVTTGTAEMTAAAGAGAGREMAQREYGEDSWQATMAELAGGVIAGQAPFTAASRTAQTVDWVTDVLPGLSIVKNATRNIFGLEPSATATRAARERLRGEHGLVDDPTAVQANLRGLGEDVDAGLLTPAQLSGDQGIMSLAAKARADDPKLMAHWRGQIDNAFTGLRNQLTDLTGAERAAIEDRLGQTVDDLFVVAAANARRKIADMTPNQRRSEASATFQHELEAAMRAARRQEREIWGAVPDDMVMPAEGVRTRYQQMLDSLGPVSADDMPEVARRFLDPNSPETWLPPAAGDAVDVVPLGNLQDLRSRLLDEAARYRAAGEFNKARLSRELAEGLLDDMTNVAPSESPGTEALQTALGFSRRLNDRFTRGPVAEVLATSPRRETRIAPEEALDRTIGRGGVRAERSAAAFVRAFENPNDTVRGAFNDYLQDDFLRMAAPGGEFNPAGAQRFMAKYRDLFDARPALRQQFQEATDAGDLARVTQRIEDGAARVLGRSNPSAEVRAIKQAAQSDPTGAVWQHFRESMTGEVLKRATRTRDGEAVVSGQAIRQLLDDPTVGPALRATYNRTELANLRRIANTAVRLEQDMAARPASAFETAEPGLLTRIASRVTGARVGSALDGMLGGPRSAGTSLQAAQLGATELQNLVRRGVRNPVAKVLHQALNDRELLDTLMTVPQSQREVDRVAAKLNTWMVDLLDQLDREEMGGEYTPQVGERLADRVGSIPIRGGAREGGELRDVLRR